VATREQRQAGRNGFTSLDQQADEPVADGAEIVDLSKERPKRLSPEQVPAERKRLIKQAVDEFNASHALARIKGKAYILTEEPDEIGNPSYVLMGEKDFGLFYRNRKVRLPKVSNRNEVEWEYKPAGTLWLESTERRTVTSITFKPGSDTKPHEYNIFKGWGVVPSPDYDPKNPTKGCKRILGLCRDLFGQDEQSFRWAMAWLAQMVQNPESKPGTAIVLRSQEGTGKGTFMNSIMRPILRGAFVQIAHRKHLTSSFNSIWQGSLMMFVDEAVWAGDKEGQGVLNALITEDTIMIEGKGKDAFPMPNLARLLFASNNDWVVPAGPTARRFGVYDCSEAHMQDGAYFAEVRKEADNGGREAFLAYLLNLDISGIDLRNPVLTAPLIRQKISTLRSDTVAHWWFERLLDGELFGPDELMTNGLWPRQITRERVRASYAAYCQRMKVQYPASAEEIGRRLKDDFGVGMARTSTVQPDGTRPNLYTFKAPGEEHLPGDGLTPAEREEKAAAYRLAHFRGIFERKMFGGAYDWPTEDTTDEEVPDEADRIPY